MLTNKFGQVYKANERWAQEILNGKGNKGRDTFYAFVNHWIDALVKKNFEPSGIMKVEPNTSVEGVEGSKKVIAFDFTSNQDLKIGDSVEVNGKNVKVTNLKRVQDVYDSEEDFNANQDIYQNTGLTWEGNQIMTVDVDAGGIEVEHFVYEIEKPENIEGSKKVAKKQIWVGYKGGKMEKFYADKTPTEESHGSQYGAVIGPFETERGADVMVSFGRGNPHIQQVEDAERLAKDPKIIDELVAKQQEKKQTKTHMVLLALLKCILTANF